MIDVHLHALPVKSFGQPGESNPATGKPSAATSDDAVMRATIAAMERHNIVKGVTSGTLELVSRWKTAAPNRIIGGPAFEGSLPDLSLLRKEYVAGRLGVMGEIGAQYAGLTPNDPQLEPYFALAEELDVPVGIHTGTGPPEMPYNPCCPKHRVALGNPILLEEVLVKHPKLRLYIMHAGWPYLEETKAIMWMYPQVYADLSGINWMRPREEFHEYLRGLMRAGFGKRLMFGSDQMVWPEAIALAIEAVESARFLTAEQKRDIFYNNAARFLRLDTKGKMSAASR